LVTIVLGYGVVGNLEDSTISSPILAVPYRLPTPLASRSPTADPDRSVAARAPAANGLGKQGSQCSRLPFAGLLLGLEVELLANNVRVVACNDRRPAGEGGPTRRAAEA
jgi:hypothetical protein